VLLPIRVLKSFLSEKGKVTYSSQAGPKSQPTILRKPKTTIKCEKCKTYTINGDGDYIGESFICSRCGTIENSFYAKCVTCVNGMVYSKEVGKRIVCPDCNGDSILEELGVGVGA
jgi:Zn finger protein HypA/HybF involved in hydrogenase expression